jgi:hypothetical protein
VLDGVAEAVLEQLTIPQATADWEAQLKLHRPQLP